VGEFGRTVQDQLEHTDIPINTARLHIEICLIVCTWCQKLTRVEANFQYQVQSYKKNLKHVMLKSTQLFTVYTRILHDKN